MTTESCTCTPCLAPGNGGPTPGHCAACCGQTLIDEYDHQCPITEHREWAERQFPSRDVDLPGMWERADFEGGKEDG